MHRGRHVIFYLRQAGGIVVARILHDRMLPAKHRIDESIEDPDAEDTDDQWAVPVIKLLDSATDVRIRPSKRPG